MPRPHRHGSVVVIAGAVARTTTALLGFTVLAILAVPGCGEEAGHSLLPPDDDDLPVEYLYDAQWLNPRPQGNSLFSVALLADGSSFAVGNRGTVVENNGDQLRVHRISDEHLFAVWGEDAGDLFVADGRGEIHHYDGGSWSPTVLATPNPVYAIHGLSSTSVWAATYEGELFHYDGAEWTLVTDLDVKSCYAVWAASEDLVFVAGRGRIGQWDGTSGSVVYVSPDSAFIGDIWGRSATDIYAVGHDRTLLHFDGATWSAIPLDVDVDFFKIAGAGSEVWATTLERGQLAKIDGARVVLHAMPFNDFFLDIDVRGAGDVLAVGFRGSMAALRGEDWRLISSAYAFPLVAITGFEGTACAFGDRVSYLRVEGDRVRRVSIDAIPVNDAWSPDGRELILVGDRGRIQRGRGDEWSRDSSGTDADLLAVHGSSETDVWAVGAPAKVLHYDGVRWSPIQLPREWYVYWVTGVWSFGLDDAYILMGGVAHYDGTSWRRIEEFDASGFVALWGRSPEEIYFVGEAGRTARYDGASAVPLESAGESLVDIHGNSRGDICAVSRETLFWLIDGVWVKATNPALDDLEGVWVGEDGFAYVISVNGAVLRVGRPPV